MAGALGAIHGRGGAGGGEIADADAVGLGAVGPASEGGAESAAERGIADDGTGVGVDGEQDGIS